MIRYFLSVDETLAGVTVDLEVMAMKDYIPLSYKTGVSPSDGIMP